MKALTAYTFEIDDVDFAVNEILSQLDLENNLKTNSIGILTCYAEFIDSGVVDALCSALPFDVAGCTTLAGSAGGEHGYLMLSLMVITGDNVRFSTALSASLQDTQREPVKEAYEKATGGFDNPPALIMAFAPLIRHVGGELIVELLDEVSSGCPIFGTLALDHTIDFAEAKTIYNGRAYFNELVLLCIDGEINPEFMVMSVPEEKAIKQKAIVTDSEGNLLKAINDISFLEYVRTLGVSIEDGSVSGLITVPMVIDYNDGTKPTMRAVYLVTDEGYAVCGGKVPVYSTIAIGSLEQKDVIEAAAAAADQILSFKNKTCAFLFPCLSRNLVLDMDPTVELKTVSDRLHGNIPYIMGYSGGEICPVVKGEGTINRFHNFTLIACAF